MKLSFSTRGWGDGKWQEFVEDAVCMHFDGIEVHDVFAQDSLSNACGPFNIYNVASTYRHLRDNGLTVPCFDSGADLSEADSFKSISSQIRLASDMRCPYVGVYASKDEPQTIRKNISDLLPLAREKKVTLLIKTNGIYTDTEALVNLLNEFADDALAVLWDVHHPYRDKGESPAQSIRNLGAYVKHVHLRDSDDNGNYALVGEGSLPVDEVMNALRSIDYDGFISLEWKPEWMNEVKDRAIIFPFFVNYLQRYIRGKEKLNTLIPNHDGSGYYIWKKDEFVNMTFSQVLDKVADYFPDQYCFKYTTLDYTRTYSEFRKDVDDFARALVSLGVRRGSKVSIWATNIPAWYITFWATVKIGAVLVTVNTAYKIHEVEYLLRQSDTHTLVMIDNCLDSNYKEIINELCPEIAKSQPGKPLHCKKLPFLRNVITVGFKQKGCLDFDEAMERKYLVSKDEVARMAEMVKPDDVCNMQYTSGTTGFPKGVMLTHFNVVNNGKCIGDRMGLSSADRMMIQVPMFHCFGMVLSMTSSITHAATISPIPYFSAKASLACINQEKITCFNGVPTMFIAMFNHPNYRKTDFSHIRTGIMAGSGCPPELMKRAAREDEMNMTGIVSVYGQTESSPGSTMSAWTDSLELRTETVGYAFPHVECKVIDPATGLTVPDGVNGEFCSRGYNTMKGYYKMPYETSQTIDAEGWLHSGDLACRNSDGTYKITGRLKDMIIRGGENIYPKEIEEFIYTHPAVKDVQVIGVPDEKYGEEAYACIVLKEGENVTEAQMHDYIVSKLARHKVPKYIEFVSGFPMNAAGKILKYKMREAAVERLKKLGGKQ